MSTLEKNGWIATLTIIKKGESTFRLKKGRGEMPEEIREFIENNAGGKAKFTKTERPAFYKEKRTIEKTEIEKERL